MPAKNRLVFRFEAIILLSLEGSFVSSLSPIFSVRNCKLLVLFAMALVSRRAPQISSAICLV